ncbi:hypothetical protein G7Y79_00012g033490 [Physcia stellaris]|nr:hypothetical protein G7Y79_00012g033490 [Physcia stellaris]
MTTNGAKASPQNQPSSEGKSVPVPSPSASVLVISAKNEILLLRRVKNSTSFASAHVFPGGHISPQDGDLPPLDDVRRHEDSEAYRIGAVRECFEETGILLAKRKGSEGLLELSDAEREEGRHAVHSEKIPFREWVDQRGGVAETASLIPFTRWLTPINVPRQRYSTQMYIYFLPLSSPTQLQAHNTVPTSDGGIEHTEAHFKPVSEWLRLFQEDQVILFPPQFFLLSLLAPFLSATSEQPSTQVLQSQRDALMDFINRTEEGESSWAEKSISPKPLFKQGERMVFSLDEPGPELEGTGRKGDGKRMITWIVKEGRPQSLEVRWRADVERERKEAQERAAYFHEITREEAEKGRSERQWSGGRGKKL